MMVTIAPKAKLLLRQSATSVIVVTTAQMVLQLSAIQDLTRTRLAKAPANLVWLVSFVITKMAPSRK